MSLERNSKTQHFSLGFYTYVEWNVMQMLIYMTLWKSLQNCICKVLQSCSQTLPCQLHTLIRSHVYNNKLIATDLREQPDSTGVTAMCVRWPMNSVTRLDWPSSWFEIRLHQSVCACSTTSLYVQGGPQKWQFFWYVLTSSNINQFSKLFHCQNQEKTCKNNDTKDHTTPQVCRYTTSWNVKCLQSNNWIQNHFCNNRF